MALFGNGTGLALAFLALGLRGVRAGMAYGLMVCAGLIFVLIVSPDGRVMLFPLNAVVLQMTIGGHLAYGLVLGALSRRVPREKNDPVAWIARRRATTGSAGRTEALN